MRIALLFVLLLSACGGASEPVDVSELSLEQRGRVVFAKCQTCHTLNEGGRHRVGPNLWGMFGSTAGEKSGFAYSKAMRASDVVWEAETLDAYLVRPADYIKGTRMSFVGLKLEEDREAVIAYLREQTGGE